MELKSTDSSYVKREFMQARATILELLNTQPTATTSEIMMIAAISKGTVNALARRMIEAGELRRIKRGIYAL